MRWEPYIKGSSAQEHQHVAEGGVIGAQPHAQPGRGNLISRHLPGTGWASKSERHGLLMVVLRREADIEADGCVTADSHPQCGDSGGRCGHALVALGAEAPFGSQGWRRRRREWLGRRWRLDFGFLGRRGATGQERRGEKRGRGCAAGGKPDGGARAMIAPAASG